MLCPECGRRGHRFVAKTCKAWVLDTSGFVRYSHIPHRCQAQKCPLNNKFLWANFAANKKGQHELARKIGPLPSIFMVTPKFGVTLAWYRLQARGGGRGWGLSESGHSRIRERLLCDFFCILRRHRLAKQQKLKKWLTR
jgi:hypothetical protein